MSISVGAVESRPGILCQKAGPTGLGFESLGVHAAARKEGLKELDCADLLTRILRPIVYALIPDHALREIDNVAVFSKS